ncbi:hypothetical protein OH76DRAFT_1361159 [Lentinus brumalis]|uniref:C2H2-type domain-containing protein n=1 Tax=Lentinus brumalis TaxID=2498619 RepID=A0A371CT75_9APHY|nr:hypothetical protein OH76DRAFT_1361159 [Polyporus brumalis]
MSPPRCLCCKAEFNDKAAHGRHLGNARVCQKFYDELSTQQATRTLEGANYHPAPIAPARAYTPVNLDDLPDNFQPAEAPVQPDNHDTRAFKRRRVTVEEVEDEDAPGTWSHEPYPSAAGVPIGKGTTFFESLRTRQTEQGIDAHAPFQDDEEWGLAKWLITEVTQGGVDRFSKLPIMRNRAKLSFKNKKGFFKKIDSLPTGTPWICDLLTVTGDLMGPKGENLTEELELWRRDPVECVEELIGNPAFEPHSSYAPVRVKKAGVRYYGEMNTCDWWWDKQGELPPGATAAPVILASDKTTLTVLRGDKTAWPVYLSIGNIDKAVRRKPSAHAFVLLGYVPVAKLKCFSDGARSEASYRLFHTCMAKMLEPLIEAGTVGVDMTCADALVRRVFPLLAAYIADHPEQCLVACCKENRCPRCLVPRNERGEPTAHTLRDHKLTADLLRRAAGDGDPLEQFAEQGLRPVHRPFWADLPHTDIFSCIAPDILHQIHKGVLKDHLLEWCQDIIGVDELDARFAMLPEAHGLRHFGRGISVITQWTGGEAKEVEKVLLGLLAGQTSVHVQKAARGLLDFFYYAQLEVHSDETLARMDAALATFHEHKDEFVALGIREHFNIPKLHSLVHYVEAIRRLGCLDGVNTETSERLHIDFAKNAYRASSRREYFTQMTTWLQRQEAVVRKDAFLSWVAGALDRDEVEEKSDSEGDEEDDEEEEEEDGQGGERTAAEDEVAIESVNALRQLMHSNVMRAYQIPVKPSASRISFQTIITNYGATAILPRLQLYLATHHPNSPLPDLSTPIDVYHFIHLLLPPNIHVANSKCICKIRASPAVPRRDDKKAIREHFDCALFVEDTVANHREGGLAGLRAAQVRAIFRLPEGRGYDQEPLMYVHWFRPFRNPDAVTGLPPTSHSTRDQMRHVEVVPASRLVRSCYLLPRFRQDDPQPDWTSENILDYPLTFAFNRYFDFHTFCSLSREYLSI